MGSQLKFLSNIKNPYQCATLSQKCTEMSVEIMCSRVNLIPKAPEPKVMIIILSQGSALRELKCQCHAIKYAYHFILIHGAWCQAVNSKLGYQIYEFTLQNQWNVTIIFSVCGAIYGNPDKLELPAKWFLNGLHIFLDSGSVLSCCSKKRISTEKLLLIAQVK